MPGDLYINIALTIPAAELRETFVRSSGPGGQGVNTADSRAVLRWNPAASHAVAVLPLETQALLLGNLARTLVQGHVVVTASTQRQQLDNRKTAGAKLAKLVRAAMAPPPPPRRRVPRSAGVRRRERADREHRSARARQRRRQD